MATFGGASGDQPSDSGRGGSWGQPLHDIPLTIRRKPVRAPREQDTQENKDEEAEQLALTGTSALGPSSRARDQTDNTNIQGFDNRYTPHIATLQIPPTRQLAAEGGAYEERVPTIQEPDDHGSPQGSVGSHRSGVSDLHPFELDRLEEMRRLGAVSPAISLPSRLNSPEPRSISERRSALTLQTTTPSQPDIPRGIQKELPSTPGAGIVGDDLGARSSLPNPQYIDHATQTEKSIRRQPKSRYSESPYRERQNSFPLSARRCSEGSALQQSDSSDAFESESSRWIPDPRRLRDTMRASAEGWPHWQDIDSANESVFTSTNYPQTSPEQEEGVQQVYGDPVGNSESAPQATAGRSGSVGHERTVGASVSTANMRSSTRRVSDSTAMTPSSQTRSYTNSGTSRPRTDGSSHGLLSGARATTPTAHTESPQGRDARLYRPREGRGRSDIPRMPVRESSTSSVEADSCCGLSPKMQWRRPSQT